MKNNPNIGANLTAFEQDVDHRTREYFKDTLPWVINDYSPQQMQYLYELYWAEQFREQFMDKLEREESSDDV